MNIVFVLNPKAGSHSIDDFKAVLSRQLQDCRQAGRIVHAEIMVPESAEALRQQLRKRLQDDMVDLVGVAGGDGSIMEALPVLVDFPKVKLGIIPQGTGNLLAVNLGIPIDTEQALEVIFNGQAKRIDIGRIGESYFALLAGAGAIAEIMETTTSTDKQLFGWMSYLVGGIRNLFRSRHAAFKLTIDDGRVIRGRGVSVVVSNAASIMRPCLPLTPDAEPDDGKLDVCFIKARGRRDYIPTIYELLTRQCEEHPEHVHYFQARGLRIETRPRLKIQADGNIIGHTPVDVSILPGRIEVMVPAPQETEAPLPENRSFMELLRQTIR